MRKAMDSTAVFAHRISVSYIVASVVIQVLLNKSAPAANMLLGVAGGAGLGYLASSMADRRSHKALAVLLPVLAAVCVTLITASVVHPFKPQGKAKYSHTKTLGEALTDNVNALVGPNQNGPSTTTSNVKDAVSTLPAPGNTGNTSVVPGEKINSMSSSSVVRASKDFVKPIMQLIKDVLNSTRGK